MSAEVCGDCRGSLTQHRMGGVEGCECHRCLYLRPERCRLFRPVPVGSKTPEKRRRRNAPEVLNGARDTATQIEGGVKALPRSGTRRREAYDVIRAAGLRGLTFDELCGDLGRSYSQTGPRVRELVADGWVRKSAQRRGGASGALQDVWVATCYDRQFGQQQTLDSM